MCPSLVGTTALLAAWAANLLLGNAAGDSSRKYWIEQRFAYLADISAVAVGGFSVMDNYLHVLVRLDPEVAQAWFDEDVVRRRTVLKGPKEKS
jgi:hypothetical protein